MCVLYINQSSFSHSFNFDVSIKYIIIYIIKYNIIIIQSFIKIVQYLGRDIVNFLNTLFHTNNLIYI